MFSVEKEKECCSTLNIFSFYVFVFVCVLGSVPQRSKGWAAIRDCIFLKIPRDGLRPEIYLLYCINGWSVIRDCIFLKIPRDGLRSEIVSSSQFQGMVCDLRLIFLTIPMDGLRSEIVPSSQFQWMVCDLRLFLPHNSKGWSAI